MPQPTATNYNNNKAAEIQIPETPGLQRSNAPSWTLTQNLIGRYNQKLYSWIHIADWLTELFLSMQLAQICSPLLTVVPTTLPGTYTINYLPNWNGPPHLLLFLRAFITHACKPGPHWKQISSSTAQTLLQKLINEGIKMNNDLYGGIFFLGCDRVYQWWVWYPWSKRKAFPSLAVSLANCHHHSLPAYIPSIPPWHLALEKQKVANIHWTAHSQAERKCTLHTHTFTLTSLHHIIILPYNWQVFFTEM